MIKKLDELISAKDRVYSCLILKVRGKPQNYKIIENKIVKKLSKIVNKRAIKYKIVHADSFKKTLLGKKR